MYVKIPFTIDENKLFAEWDIAGNNKEVMRQLILNVLENWNFGNLGGAEYDQLENVLQTVANQTLLLSYVE